MEDFWQASIKDKKVQALFKIEMSQILHPIPLFYPFNFFIGAFTSTRISQE